MSHDHEALHLAVASLDFELSPQEQARMQAGLLECAECAETVSSHNDLVRILGRLPVRDASPYVRERVLRAALVPPRDRPWPVLLVAAALLGLLIAAGAAAGAFRERQPLDAVVVVPSGSPPALGDVVASPLPSGSPGAPASDSGTGGSEPWMGGPPIPPDTLAEVVSGPLRIRSEPRVADDSIKYEPLLDVGDHLFVLDGPVVANEYAWYQVTAWRPRNGDQPFPVGWIARGDHDGTPWIRPRAAPCPTGAITMEVIVALSPEERVACLADRPLRLRAFVHGGTGYSCTADPEAPCIDGPSWLTDHGGSYGEADVRGGVIGWSPRLALDPSGPVPASSVPEDAMVELEGGFDHPAARDCRPGPARVEAGLGPLAGTAARLACRSRFVVTRIQADPMYPVRETPAVTVSNNLRVRSGPSLDSERYELLPDGTPVWVVDGPVVAADYEWFQVIVPSVDAGDGSPRVGWVAASDHGAERWLAKRTLDCPDPGSIDLFDLDRLATTGAGDTALGCYGSTTLRFRGSVQLRCGVEGRPGWGMSPDWLSANAFHQLELRDGDAVVMARPGPGLGVSLACDALDGAERSIEGHFDDSAASECEATPRSTSEPPEAAVAAFWCQTTLVVDRLVPMPVVLPTAGPR